MIKLPVDVKEKWVTALRGPNYKQTRGILKSEDGGYCCVGVLCDLVGVEFEWDPFEDRFKTPQGASGLPWAEDLPQEIANVLLQPWGEKDELGEHLTRLNDVCHMTFSQIADWIEENL